MICQPIYITNLKKKKPKKRKETLYKNIGKKNVWDNKIIKRLIKLKKSICMIKFWIGEEEDGFNNIQ
jgi:hypothetical protein